LLLLNSLLLKRAHNLDRASPKRGGKERRKKKKEEL